MAGILVAGDSEKQVPRRVLKLPTRRQSTRQAAQDNSKAQVTTFPQLDGDIQKKSFSFQDSSSAINGFRSHAKSDTSSDDEGQPAALTLPSQYKSPPVPTSSMRNSQAPQSTFQAGPFTTTRFTSIPFSQLEPNSTPQPASAMLPATMPSHPKKTESDEQSQKADLAAQRELAVHLAMLTSTGGTQARQNELAGSPIFTTSVLRQSQSSFSQFGFIAGDADILEQIATTGTDIDSLPADQDPRIYFNISAPSSAFICGSQGSGKSHTLSCLLENCLLKSDVSKLDNPLSGLVFHYDSFSSDIRGTPCEAAQLSSNFNIKVRILCSPANVQTMKRTYEGLNVEVEPLMINQHDLNTKRMLDLMAVNTEDGKMPLYLHEITRILREMRVTQQNSNGSFNYAKFKQEVENSPMTSAQQAPLTQRLDTLESFMPKSQTTAIPKKGKSLQQAGGNDWSVKAGMLTIVDLSCPCVTAEGACALFNMCLSLFLEQKTEIGRVVALDEAHKYMSAGSEASALTNTLLSSIRLQRHLGTRVFISTQEPSISPKLLDLCSITIVHRFTSPDWLRCLKSHLAALDSDEDLTANPKLKRNNVFNQIVKLEVGQALLFAPSAVISIKKAEDEAGSGKNDIQRLGIGYLRIKIRKRVTADGGRSVLALGSDSPLDIKGATNGASIFGRAATTSNCFTSTAPASTSMYEVSTADSIAGGKPAAESSTKKSNGLSSSNSNTAPFTVLSAAATSTFTGFSNTTTPSSNSTIVHGGLFANMDNISLKSRNTAFGHQAASNSAVFSTNATRIPSQNTTMFRNADQAAVKTEPGDLRPSTSSGNLGVNQSSLGVSPTIFQGVFPPSSTSFPFSPSTWNFHPYIEKEPNSSTNQMNSFQTITFKFPWSGYSLEELRLGDYGHGNKMA